MALSDFKGPNYIDDWSMDLDYRWPERIDIFESIVRTIVSWCENSNRRDIRLLELGVGAGFLARSVLNTLEAHVQPSSYLGIDINPKLTQHTLKRLSGLGHPDISVNNADLNGDFWAEGLEVVDVAYTFQTLHDLAGYAALTAVYQQFFSLITPGGLMLNADFVVPFPTDDTDKPRRFPVETHHQLLESIGFMQFKCETSIGKLACLTAVRP